MSEVVLTKRFVRIDVVDVPNTTRDVKNKTGRAKKILPGIAKTLTPVMDKSGRLVPGVTKEEYDSVIAKDPFSSKQEYVDFYTNIYIKIEMGGKELDLSIPRDYLIWKFLQHHPEVCTDRKLLNPAKHTYLMIDKEEEAEEKLSAMDYKVEAFGKLANMTEEEVKDFLILYGRNPSNTSYKVAKTLLGDFIEANPKKFVTLYTDSAREYKISFKKLLSAKILERRGGVYYYGEDVALGATPEQAVEHLRDAGNQELYIRLIELLEEE
jgi:hypothetical protein